MHQPEIIRRSPIGIVRNFIALQFAAASLYFLAGAFAYYADIWRNLLFSRYFSFQIAQVGFIFVIETLLILYIFFMWWRNVVTVTADQVQEHEGVFFRHHTIISRSRIASATFTQGLVGRITHYGNVIIRDGEGMVLLRLKGMPEPKQFVDGLVSSNVAHVTDTLTDPYTLLGVDEHEQFERKSTLRWDMASGKVNKSLERAAIKTVAAFLNGDGGHLMLGVADDGTPVGMAQDYATLTRKDADGLTNHFGNIFNTMIGAHVRHLVRVRPFAIHDRECMLISVIPSPRPVYVNDEGKEDFFVRTGNGTTSLRLSEVQAYIDAHWHVLE